ncbi:nucleotidyltransferase family protein [Dokdonella sp. MW10]|uniref:nucleotidyltransferase family protein n=1 Tax=Dokdonella sp. MW10 TaxID=2992926 RepID=UPI003F7D8AA6
MTHSPDGDAPRHGVIVLAAGSSSRLGRPKQLVMLDGEPLVRRVVRFALETSPLDAVVVTGAPVEGLDEALHRLAARHVRCDDHAQGMSASLRTGLAALTADCAAALVVLTDQPALDAAHLEALVSTWRARPEHAVASGYADTLGVPAVLPRAWFTGLATLQGDRGARDLLRARRAEVEIVAAPALAADLDTTGDLARWSGRAD